MTDYYIMPTLLFHLQQTAEIHSWYRRKKIYTDISILIKYFFNRAFVLLLFTKNPTQTPVFKIKY